MNERVDAVPYDKFSGQHRLGNRLIDYEMRVPKEEAATFGRAVLVVHGICADMHSVNPYARSLTQTGVATMTISLPEGSRGWADDVAGMNEYLQHTLGRPVTLVGNSNGGLVSVEAALLSPANTDLLLSQSAGFGGVKKSRAVASIVASRPDNTHIHHERKMVRGGIEWMRRTGRDVKWVIDRAASEEGIELAGRLPATVRKEAMVGRRDLLINAHLSRLGLERAGFSVLMYRKAWGHGAISYFPNDVADTTNLFLHEAAALVPAESAVLLSANDEMLELAS